MRLLLTLPLGLLIGAALGGLGGGGSILAVPALVYAVGLGSKPAVTTSLVIVGVSALVGMLVHWRGGRVRLAAGWWFGIAGVAGSLLGSRLNRAVDPNALLVAFSGVMLVAAWRMWASARATSEATPAASAGSGTSASGSEGSSTVTLAGTRPSASTPARVAGFVAAGTVVGFMTGFFGVGGGFVIVPALVLVMRFGMAEAVGTSLLVIAINSASALASRLATTGVDWHVALPFTAAGVLGSLVGYRLSSRAPSATVVQWFVGLLVTVALYTLARSLLAL